MIEQSPSNLGMQDIENTKNPEKKACMHKCAAYTHVQYAKPLLWLMKWSFSVTFSVTLASGESVLIRIKEGYLHTHMHPTNPQIPGVFFLKQENTATSTYCMIKQKQNFLSTAFLPARKSTRYLVQMRGESALTHLQWVFMMGTFQI